MTALHTDATVPLCLGHLLVAPSGEIDLATAPQLRSDLSEAAESDSSLVVLDLADVSFLDSIGLSVIVGGHRQLKADGRRLHLARPMPMVRKVLEITRVASVIPTYPSLDDAVADCPHAHLA